MSVQQALMKKAIKEARKGKFGLLDGIVNTTGYVEGTQLTPLLWLANEGALDALSRVLPHQVARKIVQQTDNDGHNVLYYLARFPNQPFRYNAALLEQLASKLVELGLEPIAVEECRNSTVKKVMQPYADFDAAMKAICSSPSRVSHFQRLFDSYSNDDIFAYRDKEGKRFFYHFIHRGHGTDSFWLNRILTSPDFDINAPDGEDGLSVLDYFVQMVEDKPYTASELHTIVATLLRHGALRRNQEPALDSVEALISDHERIDAAVLAFFSDPSSTLELQEVFRQCSMENINAYRDKYGRGLFHLAINSGQMAVIDICLEQDQLDINVLDDRQSTALDYLSDPEVAKHYPGKMIDIAIKVLRRGGMIIAPTKLDGLGGEAEKLREMMRYQTQLARALAPDVELTKTGKYYLDSIKKSLMDLFVGPVVFEARKLDGQWLFSPEKSRCLVPIVAALKKEVKFIAKITNLPPALYSKPSKARLHGLESLVKFIVSGDVLELFKHWHDIQKYCRDEVTLMKENKLFSGEAAQKIAVFRDLYQLIDAKQTTEAVRRAAIHLKEALIGGEVNLLDYDELYNSDEDTPLSLVFERFESFFPDAIRHGYSNAEELN